MFEEKEWERNPPLCHIGKSEYKNVMKFKRLTVLILLLNYSCTVSKKQDTALIEQPAKPEKPIFFVSVPITKFSSIESPCVDVDVEGKMFSMELDLGYRGDVTVTRESSDLISSKEFIREKLMYGVRGKEYSTNLYRIPKTKIGKMTFFKPTLQEETKEFIRDSTFVQDGGEPTPREPGRLGWELFYNVNLLVDIKNTHIAFCDSLETLGKQGYAIECLTKTPLFIERGLLEFDAETPEGILRCILDTGATCNLLNSEIEDEKSLDQVIWDPDNGLEYSFFKIEGKDFGPISFHRIPIKLPIHIEAILGMEFFQENKVFLDFSGKCAYFAKDEWLTAKPQKNAPESKNSQ